MTQVAQIPRISGADFGGAARPNPSVWHLLSPKWQSALAKSRPEQRSGPWRAILLGVLGIIFWAFIFGVLYRLLLYFKGVPEIGELLAGKLLGLILVGFFAVLLLSNVMTELSSFFLARDLDLLVSGPVDWFNLYVAKLLETLLHSSWMVVLMAVPMFSAFGIVYDGGPFFPLVVIGTFVPFLLIPAVVGSAITLILVNLFPARRTRDILSVIAVHAQSAAQRISCGAGPRSWPPASIPSSAASRCRPARSVVS